MFSSSSYAGWTKVSKNADKEYHIDYLFLRQHGVVTVGDFQDCIKYSDHMPMMVDMNL
jgi:hypothetical protein